MSSFKHLRTVHSVVYSTLCEAAKALGLLVNDTQYHAALSEAAVFKSAFEMRLMFAIILVHSPPARPQILFNNHLKDLSNDVPRKLFARYGLTSPTAEQIRGYTFWLLRQTLAEMHTSFYHVGVRPSNSATATLHIVAA
jgi:hypothetical protein